MYLQTFQQQMRSNWNMEANMLAVITIVSLNNITEA
jgi:hypothetical protein